MGHEVWMRLALDQAAQAGDDVPVGAVVVKDGTVLAAAHNRRESDGAPFAHAELLAMQQAARLLGTRRLTGCTLYVTLEPCPMCAGAALLARVPLVVYGATNDKFGALVTRARLADDPQWNHRVAHTGGVLAAECAALLREYFARRRRG